jgi:aspartate racemase
VTGHVGIVACSAEGAALCYRTICQEGEARLGPHAHPRVTLDSISLAEYVRLLERDDWPGVADLMLDSAERLARAGAGILICPDNTIHAALPAVRPRSPRPWLHIAEVVAARAHAAGFRRVGISGTRWLVDGPVYPDALAARGIECVRPDAADRDRVDRLIMDELVRGRIPADAEATFRGVFTRLRDRQCEAVVLGCTEIPLVMSDANSPLPTLDSTRLLARAALDWAVGG